MSVENSVEATDQLCVSSSVDTHDTNTDTKKAVEQNGTAGKKKRGNRRRDGQALTEVLNSVSEVEDVEERMKALARLVLAAREETKEAKAVTKSREARIAEVERERDAKGAEASKAILVRSQMESLCRELQRHNNTLQEKLRLRVREDEEKRRETANNFQTKISEITTMIEDSNARNNQLKDQNAEIREQLTSVIQRYAVREESVNKLLKAAEEQTKLAEERIKRTEQELQLSHELYKRDRETWFKLEDEYKNQIKLRELSETKLSAEVKIYSDKYQDFQNAFKKFQTEMTSMTKKIGAMEKESLAWKDRYEKTAATLFDVAKQKETVEFNCEKLKKVIGTLQSLSRKLVEERDELRKVAEAANGNVSLEQEKWEKLIGDCSRRLKEAEELASGGTVVTNGVKAEPVPHDSNSNKAGTPEAPPAEV